MLLSIDQGYRPLFRLSSPQAVASLVQAAPVPISTAMHELMTSHHDVQTDKMLLQLTSRAACQLAMLSESMQAWQWHSLLPRSTQVYVHLQPEMSQVALS